MSTHALFGYLTAVTFLIGFVPYVRDILRGKTKPERMTWFVWSVMGIISFSSILANDGGWGLILPGTDTLAVIIVFILSIKRGVGGLLRRDIIALVVSGLGLAAWAATDEPVVALLVNIGIDLAGAYLTVIKTYLSPHSELLFAWLMGTLSGVLSLFAVSWTPDQLIYPVSFLLVDVSIVAAILLGRRRLSATPVVNN